MNTINYMLYYGILVIATGFSVVSALKGYRQIYGKIIIENDTTINKYDGIKKMAIGAFGAIFCGAILMVSLYNHIMDYILTKY